jgi:SAM-dependent methyltransferase
MTERVVEIPWVFSRYHGERAVLDIGPVGSHPFFVRQLKSLGIPELHGVDLSARRIDGIELTQADIRHLPYMDCSFDLITCISTLEHIGCAKGSPDAAQLVERNGDVHALREMRRVIKESGRILLSVPFGKMEYHDWFRQYDAEAWRTLTRDAGVSVIEQATFCYVPSDGWNAGLPRAGFREMGAPAAAGVLCALLGRSPTADFDRGKDAGVG